MDKQLKRRLEKIIGISFIIATLSYGIGNSLIEQSISNETTSYIGMGLELVNCIAVIVIGWLIYRVLGKEKSVKKYFLARVVEGVILAIGAISLLVLDLDQVSTVRTYTFLLAMLVLGIYSLSFLRLVIKNDLLVNWLGYLGLISYASLTVFSLIGLYIGASDQYYVLFVPGAIFEVVFPIYLIVKGFKG